MKSTLAVSQMFVEEQLMPKKMMDFLNRSYTFSRSEKYKEFLYHVGAGKDAQIKALKLTPTVMFSQSGQDFKKTTTYPGYPPKVIKFKIDTVMTNKRRDGQLVKTVYQIRGHRLIEKKTMDDKEILLVWMFDFEDLTLSMEVDEIKCMRFYKLTPSKHSIGTETSRRASLFNIAQEPKPYFEYRQASREEPREEKSVKASRQSVGRSQSQRN